MTNLLQIRYLGYSCNYLKPVLFIFDLPLIFIVDKKKRKKRSRDICKGTLDIEFKRDWSVDLGATIGDG